MQDIKWEANWIRTSFDIDPVVPMFQKTFSLSGTVKKAVLMITAMGVYEAKMNGKRIGSFILAPGWTAYQKRLQYQTYDVSSLLSADNELTVIVGNGWYRSRIGCRTEKRYEEHKQKNPAGLLAQLLITYTDGSCEKIFTDESWKCSESAVRYSEIYDGEIFDASFVPDHQEPAICFSGPTHTLIPQQGEEILEQEHLSPARIFTTPKGETVVDFGQEITGYVITSLFGSKGEILDLSFAEILDSDGNFYTENYRSAQCMYHYICKDGFQTYKPKLSFWGFRYIRVNAFPKGTSQITTDTFTAAAVYSNIKRTGFIRSSNTLLNTFVSNVFWGQKGNFLDVPTDCPQRDERLGWSGDAQIFTRAACLNFDVEKFYTKWLADLAAEQHTNGAVPHIIPDVFGKENAAAAGWSDAAVICPWQVYLAYGNIEILKNQFYSMKLWTDYITSSTTTKYLWTGGTQFGDWLGLDATEGSYKGASDDDFIASAFYAYSVSIVIKAGKILGEDTAEYETLYDKIITTFHQHFPQYHTQTECVLAIYFNLSEDCPKTAAQLAEMILSCGGHLQTGFIGTPYLLHALSKYGYIELAYSLLLRKEYPSWLYPVTKGATTIWEHWDGIREDGSLWSSDMNSYNHYAYGAAIDWIYTVAAGITPFEDAPGYRKVQIAPHPDTRLDWLNVTLKTRHGLICCEWKKQQQLWHYEITTPTETVIIIDGTKHLVPAGTYHYFSQI